MALQSALKDRARIVRSESTRTRVEGKTVMVPGVTFPWFKARLSPEGGQRTRDSEGVWKVVRSPTLLFGIKDTEGGTLIPDDGGCVLRAKDHVEVDSAQLGRSLWEVSSAPSALRKKRRVIGFEATLRRLDQEPFDRKL